MTTRAKRMRKALESMGWDCSDGGDIRECKGCEATIFEAKHKHCYRCGAKLPPPEVVGESTNVQLEAAIAYAIGERRTVPGGDSA